MTADQIYQWWFLWLVIGGVLVIAAAALLITILVLAHRIAVLARSAIEVVGEIEAATRPIWNLGATNQVAGDLLGGAQAIRDNAVAITAALSHSDEPPRTGAD